MSSIEYIRFKIEEKNCNIFIQTINQACKIIADYPDCLNYEVARCEENTLLFIWRIEWTSTNAHLNGFRKHKTFKPFFKLMQPFLNSISEMNHYKKVVEKQ
ncbi:MAG TPA: antibiotic biosynthesis monooxygenase [Flavobacteriia bacterium]|nr:antibiotic biosynthesis monooxygenase [Flavobacteriia bacterium]